MNWTAFFAAGMLVYGVYTLGLYGMLIERTQSHIKRPFRFALWLVTVLSFPAFLVGWVWGRI